MKTKIYYREGYHIEKDRIPPAAGNPKGCIIILFGLVMIIAAGVGIFMYSRQQRGAAVLPTRAVIADTTASPSPTLTPSQMNTPNSREIISTAFALITATSPSLSTSTPDYCWFLTPSPTASFTPLPSSSTPDGQQILMTATALALAQTPTSTPTSAPPFAWCNEWFIHQQNVEITDEVQSTEELFTTPIGGFPTLPPALPPTTWIQISSPVAQQSQQPPSDPIVITAPPAAPIVITQEPEIREVIVPVVITATFTPTPTVTETQTNAPTATATSTNTPMQTDTATSTSTVETPTPTPTYTATLLPTLTPTDTSTETPAYTPTTTSTDTPTSTPTETPTPTATDTQENQ